MSKLWAPCIYYKLTSHTVGIEAKINADAPYLEATMKIQKNTVGVCKTKKTLGIEFGAQAGIDISLDAGMLDSAPIFSQPIFVSLTLHNVPNSKILTELAVTSPPRTTLERVHGFRARRC